MQQEQRTILMIGNSHIDPVWLWKSAEGFQEVKATFRSAADRMEEFPDFIFTASSAAFYHWIERNAPDLFRRMAAAVASGAWSPTGGFWVEPDCNIPSGESFVRQALLGQRYFSRAFGTRPRVGYNVDSFGHHGMLPQLLRGAGLTAYVVMRPHAALLELPSPLFRWRSADGSEVLCLRLEGEYTAWTKAGIRKNIDATLAAMERSGLASLPAFYGVGNHGGGPTIENIKAIREISGEDGRARYGFGSLETFFESVDPSSLPVYEGGLEKIFPGCYSADSRIKENNRAAETAAGTAEALSSLALLSGGRVYPADELERIWQLILFNQFHDTLAGTSREDARDEAEAEFHTARTLSRHLSEAALQFLCERIDTRGEGDPLVLFNTEAVPFSGTVEVDVPRVRRKPVRLKAPDGREIPYQDGRAGLASPGARILLVFDAEVPPMGFAVYRLYAETPQVQSEPRVCEAGTFENRWFRLSFGNETGSPVSLEVFPGAERKGSPLELLGAPLRFRVYEDTRDTWGAEGEWRHLLGNFVPEDFRVLEEGSHRTILRGIYTYGRSRLVVYYRLYAGEPFWDLECELLNAEKHVQIVLALKPVFPSWNVDAGIPYGWEHREEREGENFAHGWVDLVSGDRSAGLLAANRSRYGYRLLDGEYQLVCARSAVYGRGSGSPLDPAVEYRCMDLGELRFTVRFRPHSGDLPKQAAVMTSRRLGHGPEYLLDCRHGGPEQASARGYLSLDSSSVILSAFKAAADGRGIVARMHETAGTPSPAVLKIGEHSLALEFTPFQIRTVRYLPETGTFEETNLLEEPLAGHEERKIVKNTGEVRS